MGVDWGAIALGIGIGVLLTAAGLFFYFCLRLTRYFLRPARPDPALITPFFDYVADLPEPEELRLRSLDGQALHGLLWLHPEAAGRLVILGHGVTSFKEEMLPLARTIYDLGVSACIFDFRGHGQHELKHSTVGKDEVLDLASVVQHCLAHPEVDNAQIGILGHSMGAAAVINYLAQYDAPVRFAICIACYASLDRALFQRLRRMKVPRQPTYALMNAIARREIQQTLFDSVPLNLVGAIRDTHLCFMHGTHDKGNNPQDSQDLFDQARAEKELHWIDGGQHHELLQHAEVHKLVRDYVCREYGLASAPPAEPVAEVHGSALRGSRPQAATT